MERRLLDIIGKIYDTALTHRDWLGVMSDIGDLAKGEASLLMVSPKHNTATIHSPAYGEDFCEDYFGRWAERDPTLRETMNAKPN